MTDFEGLPGEFLFSLKQHNSMTLVSNVESKQTTRFLEKCSAPCLVNTKHSMSAQKPHTNSQAWWWRVMIWACFASTGPGQFVVTEWP